MEAQKKITCMCGEPAELITAEKSFLGGRVVLKEHSYYKCKNGHEFLTKALTEKHDREFYKQYYIQRQVIKTGRSLAITVPPDFAEFYNLKKGKKVTIVPAGRKEAILRFE